MKSRLYECHVMHARFTPKPHQFVYRLFLFALDLDELPDLDQKLHLFSVNRWGFYSFRESDYLPTSTPAPGSASSGGTELPANNGGGLKQRVIESLKRHGISETISRVELITLPRVAGYLFNPVSFYFCYDVSGEPIAAIPEVTNTFREMKPFFLGPQTRQIDGRFHLRIPKYFYVSPFSDVDIAFDFNLAPPGRDLAIQIDDYHGAQRTLTSTLSGQAQPLTDRKLAWMTLVYPLITLKIITLIHWQALRLYFKRVPWFRKTSRLEDQRDLFRPHSSSYPSEPKDA